MTVASNPRTRYSGAAVSLETCWTVVPVGGLCITVPVWLWLRLTLPHRSPQRRSDRPRRTQPPTHPQYRRLGRAGAWCSAISTVASIATAPTAAPSRYGPRKRPTGDPKSAPCIASNGSPARPAAAHSPR